MRAQRHHVRAFRVHAAYARGVPVRRALRQIGRGGLRRLRLREWHGVGLRELEEGLGRRIVRG